MAISRAKRTLYIASLIIFLLLLIIVGSYFASWVLASSHERFEDTQLFKAHSLAKTTAEMNNDKYMQNSKVENRYVYLYGLFRIATRADCVYEKGDKCVEYTIVQSAKGYGIDIMLGDSYLYKYTNVNVHDQYLFVKTDSWDIFEEVLTEAYGESSKMFEENTVIGIDYKIIKPKGVYSSFGKANNKYALLQSNSDIEDFIKTNGIQGQDYLYDNEYFEDHVLIVYIFSHSHGGYKDEIECVEVIDDTVLVNIVSEIKKNGSYTQAIVEKVLLLELNKNDVPEAARVEVYHQNKEV